MNRILDWIGEDELEALGEFWRMYDRHRDALDAATEAAVMADPELVEAVASIDPEENAARDAEGKRLQEAAYVRGELKPYLEYLLSAGRFASEIGVDWIKYFPLEVAFRRTFDELADEHLGGDPARHALALRGAHVHVFLSMLAIGHGYISDRERAQKAAWSRLDFALEAAGAGIWQWDPSGGQIAWDKGVRSLYGLVDDEELTIDRFYELVVERDRERVQRDIGAAMAPGKTFQSEYTVRRPTGEDVRVASRGRLVHTEDDRMRMLGVCWDVSERYHATRELQARMSELERSNAELDRFAYIVSHDLKAPMRDIDNLAGWIVEDLGADDIPDETARHLGLLRDRVNRMERLLDDVLAYSRAGRVGMKLEPLDLEGLIAEQLALLGPRNGFDVQVSVSEAVRHVVQPRSPLSQIVRNLVDNALKHHDLERGTITVTATEDDGALVLEVADDGPGIDPRFHDRIFELFQVLSPDPDGGGTGMGLAIVRKQAESLGGAVSVRSGPGRGTAFHVRMPRHHRGMQEQR